LQQLQQNLLSIALQALPVINSHRKPDFISPRQLASISETNAKTAKQNYPFVINVQVSDGPHSTFILREKMACKYTSIVLYHSYINLPH